MLQGSTRKGNTQPFLAVYNVVFINDPCPLCTPTLIVPSSLYHLICDTHSPAPPCSQPLTKGLSCHSVDPIYIRKELVGLHKTTAALKGWARQNSPTERRRRVSFWIVCFCQLRILRTSSVPIKNVNVYFGVAPTLEQATHSQSVDYERSAILNHYEVSFTYLPHLCGSYRKCGYELSSVKVIQVLRIGNWGFSLFFISINRADRTKER